MINYKTTTIHNEESIHALSKMQYETFCYIQIIITYILAVVMIILGIHFFEKWFGVMYLFIGCLLITMRYVSANRSANKICKLIKASKMKFPMSSYYFHDDYVDIVTLPENISIDKIKYCNFIKVTEDETSFYLFPNKVGGYVVFKNNILNGNNEKASINDFKNFLLSKKLNLKQKNVPPIAKILSKFINSSKK